MKIRSLFSPTPLLYRWRNCTRYTLAIDEKVTTQLFTIRQILRARVFQWNIPYTSSDGAQFRTPGMSVQPFLDSHARQPPNSGWSAAYSKISFKDLISPGGPSTTELPSIFVFGTPIDASQMYYRPLSIPVWPCRLQYPTNGTIGMGLQQWRGNTVFKNNNDGQGVPVRQLATGQTFG
ncbi:hypothetical protein PISMIDRAFT_8614 [Pisolithus microcarpus 441]|uniref:Unplaced genomic scaffold scaffold_15, whole genome shotgun sequence n=1 Tax=Pisolithus microcarpus 441 TaxID=765257 RepID=A0A0C9ZBY3_9AGAM|nr:hypothetical protein PISMIDRAFT_8614 [Pisolithus microcarpus 441]